MTVAEAAAYLKVTPKTVYRWLNDGKLPGVKIGGNTWRVHRATLEGWMRQRSIERIIANAPRVTQEWLDRVGERREWILKGMGGVPFKGDEIDEMIDEGRR